MSLTSNLRVEGARAIDEAAAAAATRILIKIKLNIRIRYLLS